MDFFFSPPPSFVEGGGEAQENPEVLIIDYFLLLLWGFIILIIGIFEALPAARCFLHLSCGASGQWECATIRIPSPGAKKKDQEMEFGKGLRRSRGHSLPGSHPHPRQPRSGAGRDRCKLRRWAQKLSPNPVWLLWLGCNGASRCTQGARRLPPK